LRGEKTLGDPVAASASIAKAAMYSQFLDTPPQNFGIFDDVCVTSWVSGTPLGHKLQVVDDPPYPGSGFVISDAFKPIGGATGLVAMCAYCPANTCSPRPAGCAGMFYHPPGDPELQKQLLSILSRLGLGLDHAAAFAPTTKSWYGLWARSPLSADALRVLQKLMRGIQDEQCTDSELRDLTRFIRATELALQHRLHLHVSLAPPGHSDLGYVTNFPHCPFCKAESTNAGRWKRKYSTEVTTCGICGTRFVPAETARSMRDDEWDSDALRKAMGPQRFPAFLKVYLMHHGVREDLAEHIVETTEAESRERERTEELAKARERRQEQYLRTTLFAGLNPKLLRADDAENSPTSPHFAAPEFAELLRRCEMNRIKISTMHHRSKDGELDKWAWKKLDRPAHLFAKWRRQGCAEWFGATFVVPDELLPPELSS
jgi:hypothetical protein